MNLLEKFYYSKFYLKRVAKHIAAWELKNKDMDETKYVPVDRNWVKVKVDASKGVLTFTVHVRVSLKTKAWSYRKYSLINTNDDSTPYKDGDIPTDSSRTIRPGRAGKYTL